MQSITFDIVRLCQYRIVSTLVQGITRMVLGPLVNSLRGARVGLWALFFFRDSLASEIPFNPPPDRSTFIFDHLMNNT